MTHMFNAASRRNFLKASAAAGVAAIASRQILAAGPATTQANKLNVAVVGLGGQGRHNLNLILAAGDNVVGLCDVDAGMIAQAKKEAGEKVASAATYSDYRKLLEDKSIDAVLIATPDHWHATLCKAFMKAGKHVYCEKPLTHSVAEARELRNLAAASKVVTQMGNQGSASQSLRRCVELIKAGVLGQIHDVHVWLDAGGFPHSTNRPAGEDKSPDNFNWDMWVGPSPMRPYKDKTYHPYFWRGWFEFGNGQLGDFACHSFNLPMRALDLSYPSRIEVMSDGSGLETWPARNRVKFLFPARKNLDPMTIHWYDGGELPDWGLYHDVLNVYDELPKVGVLILGEKGTIFTSPWNTAGLIKLHDEPKLRDVLKHEATKDIPITLPRVDVHVNEWLTACKGGPPTYSPFQVGGLLTEIALAGVLAVRLGHSIDWDGEKQEVRGLPEATKFIHPEYRKEWGRV